MKRLHISVGVKDLQRSVEFYTTLFDAEPTVTRPGYAKWLLEDPSVNFVLDAHGCRQGVDHLGIQVDNEDELDGITTRLAQAEAPLLEQEAAECCFSKSDKSWSQDPEGVRWETFRTHGQIGWYGADTAPSEMPPDTVPESCCAVPSAAATSE